ncbi:hypothetical protein Ciccas_010954 [Cichlidogyrus casuarinus]|uniref:PCI domain-containing protein n=1 Tax=Cichlidogyrus casuarinus TaxID=1844966 RepID=A0ABD2PTG0_9PLAT
MNMVESMQVDNISLDDIQMSGAESFEQNIVIGDVPIDLKFYINNYQGNIYYLRLFYIANHVPRLKYEALKLAHDFIKQKTLNIDVYKQIFEMLIAEKLNECTSKLGKEGTNGDEAALNEAVCTEVYNGGNPAGLVYDQAWMETTRRKYTVQIEQLDTDLKNFKANAIKESIRRASDELGELYLSNGQLNNAYRCFTRSRDYCTSPYQELMMCLNVIKVAIFQNTWSCVNANVNKAEYLPEIRDSGSTDLTSPNMASLISLAGNGSAPTEAKAPVGFKVAVAVAKTLLAVAGGLCELYFGRYRSAVSYFLQVQFTSSSTRQSKYPGGGRAASGNRRFQLAADRHQVNPDHLEPPVIYATSTDIAFYMTICSLATMDRSELSTQILGPSSVNARMLLEAEPTCREVIHAFHSADYSTCLAKLAQVENQLRMDMFVSNHVGPLLQEIRSRALCQYFSPYQTASLDRMAGSFGTTRVALEAELAQLIQKGAMNARIDSHRGLLKALSVDQRSICFAQALKAADDYCRRTQTLLLRLALARQRLIVQSDRGQAQMDGYDRCAIPDGIVDYESYSRTLNNQEKTNMVS